MHGVRQRLIDGGYAGEGSRYQKQIDRLVQPRDDAKEPEPDDVAEAFLRMLNDERPHRRYLVVPNEREAEITIRAALARVAQLNAAQKFAYDRDTLVKMLDQALSAK